MTNTKSKFVTSLTFLPLKAYSLSLSLARGKFNLTNNKSLKEMHWNGRVRFINGWSLGFIYFSVVGIIRNISVKEACLNIFSPWLLTLTDITSLEFACGEYKITAREVKTFKTSPTIVIKLGATHNGIKVTTQFQYGWNINSVRERPSAQYLCFFKRSNCDSVKIAILYLSIHTII